MSQAKPANETSKGRILVVDDEALNRDLLSRRLIRKGFTVECADGAASADEQLQEASFDLILLDIMMPDVDGFEYLESLRKRWDAMQLPVIMATAKDESEDIVRALELGANDYVTKPLDFKVVQARVNTQLRLKQTTEQLAEAHRLMKEDLQRAARFQQSQLPPANLTVPGCRFAWRYLPCDALAGDFLSVIRLDDSRTAFYVLDVCGHGTPAALLSASIGRSLSVTQDESSVVTRFTRGGLIRHSRTEVVSPAEVTRRLNRQFDHENEHGKYFTMAYMILDVSSGALEFTLAGHPAQILLPRDKQATLLECDGVPVGLLADDDVAPDSFQEQTTTLNPGDRIYLFSDGVVEAENGDNEQLTVVRLREIVDQVRTLSLDESVDRVLDAVREFCGDRAFDDDLSLLAMEFDGNSKEA
ncbi:MAG: SpoIIE family protein phosphatase [Pirellulaceae bacterium]|nr:SpoIIE family protein phosphatase [Pirellulaceae bacterium]